MTHSTARRGATLLFAALACALLPATLQAASCAAPLSRAIPDRPVFAQPGSEVMARIGNASGEQRDAAVVDELLKGNLPHFLRKLRPVTLEGTLTSGRQVRVTLCVTPEYVSVGDDRDFVRVPLGLSAAARVAQEFGFLLPTPRMVDAIFDQAQARVPPSPMKPTAAMTSTAYLLEHNRMVERQLQATRADRGALAAGHKKDLVLTNRLRSKPGRVAIYGWHRPGGRPIQPLSTVHGAEYADYSHGVRLVSRTAYLDGKPIPLEEIIRDSELAPIVSREGPIRDVQALIDGAARLARN